MQDMGRMLIVMGIVIVLAGGVLLLAGRVPLLGKLPGDFTFQSGGLTCFFPLATMIVLSVLLTIILNVVGRLK